MITKKNIIIMLVFFICSHLSFLSFTLAGNSIKIDRAEKYIRIDAKIFNGETLQKILPNVEKTFDTQKYLYGSITNSSNRNITMKLNFFSPNNKMIKVKDYLVDWIPPGQKVYFLIFLGSPLLTSSDSNVQIDYQIIQKMVK